MTTNPDVRLYRGVSLARELLERGVPLAPAVRASSIAFGTSETITTRYVKAAMDGVAQARAELSKDDEVKPNERRCHEHTISG